MEISQKTHGRLRRAWPVAIAILGALVLLVLWTELYAAVDTSVLPNSRVSFQSTTAARTLLGLLRDLIPAACGIVAAYILAGKFVADLYGLKDWPEGSMHIARCLLGAAPRPYFLRVADGQVQADDDNVLVRVGGPGRVVAFNNSAALLERGGELTHMVPPGTQIALQPFEKVRDTLDLRPTRWQYEVKALSKDGIEVAVEFDIAFQINTEGRSPTRKTPFPATENAIFRAATARVLRDPNAYTPSNSLDWARRLVMDEAQECLRTIISHYTLDALVGIEQIYTYQHPRQVIQSQLREALREPAASLGAQINDVRLGSIKVGDKVAEQWLEVWSQEWQNKALKLEQNGETQRERARARAKAQAQAELIVKVTHALNVASSQDSHISSQILAMRLLEVFEDLNVDSQQGYLPTQVIETIESLRHLVYEGLDPDSASRNNKV